MISKEERKARHKAVEYAKASVGLEGISLSKGLLDITDKYIQGGITDPEFTREYITAVRNEYNGVNDSSEEEIKNKLSFIRLVELERNPIKGNFDLEHLRKINSYIFQDSPIVAGKFRSEVELKNNQVWQKNRNYPKFGNITVCYSPMDKSSIQEAKNVLNSISIGYLKMFNRDDFAKVISELYKKLDYFHPFPDGNSRTLREFTRTLSVEAGFTLDWGKNEQIEVYLARDFEVNTITLSKVFDFTQKAAIKSEIEAILQHPKYKPLSKLIRNSLAK